MGIYFKRYFTITVVAILSLAIASCSSEGEQKSNVPPTPGSVTEKTEKTATQPFKDPVVPGNEGFQPVASTASNLIQPTNAKEREAVVSKGRSDPFAQIAGQIVPTLPSRVDTTKSKPVPVLPTLTTLKRPPQSTNYGASKKPNNKAVMTAKTAKKPSLIPVLPKVLPQIVPSQKLEPVIPPPPQPKLAEAVVVSGVVVVGREPQAIIKVPNEPTSRYVQAGQRLANGLLIKRIEMNEGSEPTVILEQFGIEVAKMVGEDDAKSTEASTETTTSSTVPASATI